MKTKIEKLKDKLNIQIAEYGSNFSVGECQLICVARAILKQSQILLIDEATAHVDTKTDQLIQQILRYKFKNQTIITIAHRLNTIMDSDTIVLMNDEMQWLLNPLVMVVHTLYHLLSSKEKVRSTFNCYDL